MNTEKPEVARSSSGHSLDVSREVPTPQNTYRTPDSQIASSSSVSYAEILRSDMPVVIIFDDTKERHDRIQRLNSKSALWTKR